ncbi:LysE family translocator [Glycomyces buryatensis]|uniref:LysE family translocator n=1 Tax=Glycomyces buryatensis TaxID=2570927 RepID=A0A4S8Q6Z4_9ACTN|nr:LysE family translocator [Glycomyces buryatensis]THV40147.1 LysE family translocator [Glycomyces buryatensis]
MPTTGQLLAFLAASTIMILIPGPSVMFAIGRALSYGRRKAILGVIGNSLGVFCTSALAAVGLGAVIQQSALAFAIVKYVGAAYLIFLGVKALRDRKGALTIPDADQRGAGRTAMSIFEGFLVGVLNPKVVLFFVALLPQFVNPGAGSATLQMLLLGAIFGAIAMLLDTGWVLVASAARDKLRAPRAGRILNGVGGTSLIGLGVAAAAGERA